MGASRLDSEVRVKAIVNKKWENACAFINLVIYSKLSKRQIVNLVILYKANKSTKVLIYSSIDNFNLAIYF